MYRASKIVFVALGALVASAMFMSILREHSSIGGPVWTVGAVVWIAMHVVAFLGVLFGLIALSLDRVRRTQSMYSYLLVVVGGAILLYSAYKYVSINIIERGKAIEEHEEKGIDARH